MDNVRAILLCMEKDFAEPMSYMICGVIPALILTGILAIVRRKMGKEWKQQMVPAFLFFLYGYVTAWMALLSRAPGSRAGVDLGFLDTWGYTPQSQAYVLENILMFLPFGVLWPQMWGRAKNWKVCLISGTAVSLGIEAIQFLTQRGHCQTDDVIMNGAGTLLGWLLYTFLSTFRRKRRHWEHEKIRH